MSDRTLCFLLRGQAPGEVLLGRKKSGFGAGKVTGIGGKVEAGETVAQAALREVHEEIGITAEERDLRPMGRLSFVFPAQPAWSQVVHVFLLTAWQGEPRESAEIEPIWCDMRQIPFQRMWQDAPHWLPLVLAGQPVRMRFVFVADNETVDTWDWEEPPTTPS